MMLKTSDLKWHALDWAVHVAMHGECDGYPEHPYSADWAHGGPLIERERIGLRHDGGDGWAADDYINATMHGSTPLIAAMRCYVASVLGEEIDVPAELV